MPVSIFPANGMKSCVFCIQVGKDLQFDIDDAKRVEEDKTAREAARKIVLLAFGSLLKVQVFVFLRGEDTIPYGL